MTSDGLVGCSFSDGIEVEVDTAGSLFLCFGDPITFRLAVECLLCDYKFYISLLPICYIFCVLDSFSPCLLFLAWFAASCLSTDPLNRYLKLVRWHELFIISPMRRLTTSFWGKFNRCIRVNLSIAYWFFMAIPFPCFHPLHGSVEGYFPIEHLNEFLF